MFNQVDVQPVPGDAVLHRNDHTLVLVTSTPTAEQSEALSAWAQQSPDQPLPNVAGVAALGWVNDQYHFHAAGPMMVTLSSNTGDIKIELGPHENLTGLSLQSVNIVECRHLEHRSEMPDPFETLSSGTISASGFIATVQTPLPIEDSNPVPVEPKAKDLPDDDGNEDSIDDENNDAEPDEPKVVAEELASTDDDDNASDVAERRVPPAPPTPPVPQPPTPPAVPPEPAKNDVELSDVFVLGVVCPRCDNFNHPNAPYCYVDGHRLVETRVLQRAKRPTLGHLRLNHDGTHIQLLKSVVLGRAPDVSSLVEDKDAEGIQLEDPSMSLSRSHAVVELRDWGVYLRDDGSRNGTWVVATNGSRRRLSPGEEIELTQETMFSLGQSLITFVPAPFQ